MANTTSGTTTFLIKGFLLHDIVEESYERIRKFQQVSGYQLKGLQDGSLNIMFQEWV